MFKSVDYYNQCSKKIRLHLYKPLLRVLSSCGVTANMITNVRLVLAIVFWFYFLSSPKSASILLLVIFFLDTLDGALACYLNNASDRGKFLDIFTDHVVYTALVLSMIKMNVGVFELVFNIFIVSAVYLLATIYKGENKLTNWIIHPYPRLSYIRAIMVISFYVTVWTNVDVSQIGTLITNCFATILSLYYFFALQNRWRNNKISF